jgi:hypothetical protein
MAFCMLYPEGIHPQGASMKRRLIAALIMSATLAAGAPN